MPAANFRLEYYAYPSNLTLVLNIILETFWKPMDTITMCGVIAIRILKKNLTSWFLASEGRNISIHIDD